MISVINIQKGKDNQFSSGKNISDEPKESDFSNIFLSISNPINSNGNQFSNEYSEYDQSKSSTDNNNLNSLTTPYQLILPTKGNANIKNTDINNLINNTNDFSNFNLNKDSNISDMNLISSANSNQEDSTTHNINGKIIINDALLTSLNEDSNNSNNIGSKHLNIQLNKSVNPNFTLNNKIENNYADLTNNNHNMLNKDIINHKEEVNLTNDVLKTHIESNVFTKRKINNDNISQKINHEEKSFLSNKISSLNSIDDSKLKIFIDSDSGNKLENIILPDKGLSKITDISTPKNNIDNTSITGEHINNSKIHLTKIEKDNFTFNNTEKVQISDSKNNFGGIEQIQNNDTPNNEHNFSQSKNNSQYQNNQNIFTSNNLSNINQISNPSINFDSFENSSNQSSIPQVYHSKISELNTKISTIINKGIDGNISTAKINLSPKSLGTLVVEIVNKKDNLQIKINTENKDVAKIVESNIGNLKDNLVAQGINHNNIELNINVQNQSFNMMSKSENRNENKNSKHDKKNNKNDWSIDNIEDNEYKISNYLKFDSGKFIEKYI